MVLSICSLVQAEIRGTFSGTHPWKPFCVTCSNLTAGIWHQKSQPRPGPASRRQQVLIGRLTGWEAGWWVTLHLQAGYPRGAFALAHALISGIPGQHVLPHYILVLVYSRSISKLIVVRFDSY